MSGGENKPFFLASDGLRTTGKVSDTGDAVFDSPTPTKSPPQVKNTRGGGNRRRRIDPSNSRLSLISVSKKELEELHEKDSDTEKLLQIWVFCESQRQMHKLAFAYFQARDFYFNFLPIVILTFITGALSFFITSDAVDEW